MPLGGSSLGSTPLGGQPRAPGGVLPATPFHAAGQGGVWQFPPRPRVIVLSPTRPTWAFPPRAVLLVEGA